MVGLTLTNQWVISQTVIYTFDVLNLSKMVTRINGITSYSNDNVGNCASKTNANDTVTIYFV